MIALRGFRPSLRSHLGRVTENRKPKGSVSPRARMLALGCTACRGWRGRTTARPCRTPRAPLESAWLPDFSAAQMWEHTPPEWRCFRSVSSNLGRRSFVDARVACRKSWSGSAADGPAQQPAREQGGQVASDLARHLARTEVTAASSTTPPFVNHKMPRF